jgi:hypothetical protein
MVANATLPQTRAQMVVDNWEFLESVVIPFLTTLDGAHLDFPLPERPFTVPDVCPDEALDPTVQKVGKLRFNTDSIRNTLVYLWNHMRCGIIVAVKNGAVVCFCPFYNPTFENTWPPGVPAGAEKFEGTTKLPVDKWWANGAILCTEPGEWGTHFNLQIKDMIAEAVHAHGISNAIFCINKRDYPQYKLNAALECLVEPYGFLYDRDDRDPLQDVPLSTIDGEVLNMLPMLSFYGTTSARFLDILIPPTEDWEACTGNRYLLKLQNEPLLARMAIRELTVPTTTVPLAEKRGVAFFRGAATGSGTSPLTNQRVRLFSFAEAAKSELLDVKCVSLNRRIRKHFSEPVGVLEPSSIDFPVDERFFVPMAEQVTNRYLIYVEGHCAACRLGIMLASGCVVLKVESSNAAPDLWYSHMLRPNVHYVPIHEDLSNLLETIRALEADLPRAQAIADNARTFWEHNLSRTALVNYVGTVCAAISV